ncbi:MAG: type I DNA topoisomerase [Planctomycetes bacterium]|nr:type I DNA topoisomerase [Planctomycetota bacterium]
MAKNLVIVESPAKAKTIERYLGKDYRVEASMGHVRDLPERSLGVDIEHDFKPDYEVLRGKKKVVAGLRKAAGPAAAVFMATDLDREGEAIAWHLCEALGLAPGDVRRVVFNEITEKAIAEAFSSPGHINMNKVSAQEARRILDRLVGYKLSPLLWKKVAKGLSAGRVQSVAVRLVVEREREIRAFRPEEYWTIAAMLARPGEEQAFRALLAEVDGEKFRPAAGGAARAVGDRLRCAAYRVLAVRQKALQDKAPPPFITSELQRAAATELGFPARKTMTIAQALYQGVELGPEGSVALITYMRTDSYHVAPAALEAARALIAGTYGEKYLPPQPAVFKSRGRAQEAHEAIRPTEVARTPEAVRPHLEGDFARLYELIWNRFIASQMKPAAWNVTEADVEAVAPAEARAAPAGKSGAAAEGAAPGARPPPAAPGAAPLRALLKARGRVLVFDGHTRVSGVRFGKDDQQLPPLAEGDPLDLRDLVEEQRFTQPPDRFTEATLIRKLEGLGIGRPSTYATIISTIQDRGYVAQEPSAFLRCENHPKCAYLVPCDLGRQPMWPLPAEGRCPCGAALVPRQGKRCLYATELGEVVTDKLVRHFPDILDVRFTSHMEDELDEVEESKVDWRTVVREFWGPFSADLEKAAEEMESTKHQPVEEAGPCPQCQSPLVKRWSKHGPFLGCSKYPECKYIRPLENGDACGQAAEAAAHQAGPCPQCGSPLVARSSRRGPFLGCSKYPECTYTQPLGGQSRPAAKATQHKCPKCGSAMMLRYSRRGEPFLGCQAYPKCRATMPCDAEGKPVVPQPTGEVCDKCGAAMVVKRGGRGPFLACSAYPKCRNAKPLAKGEGKGAAGPRPAHRAATVRSRKDAAADTPSPEDARGLASAARSPATGMPAAGTTAPGATAPGATAPGATAARAPRARAARPKPVKTDRTCPDCGAAMVLRTGSRGPFLGCSKYPKCRHTEDAPPNLTTSLPAD